MSTWLKSVWLPVAIAAVAPMAVFLAVKSVIDYTDTYEFLIGWSCCLAACALVAGCRVARTHAGNSWSAVLAGLAVLAIGGWPWYQVLVFVVSEPPPDLVAGRNFMVVLVGVLAVFACVLGWLGGKLAVRYGRGHAT